MLLRKSSGSDEFFNHVHISEVELKGSEAVVLMVNGCKFVVSDPLAIKTIKESIKPEPEIEQEKVRRLRNTKKKTAAKRLN